MATAVRFARTHGPEVAVRCGGHGVLGFAVPAGGLIRDGLGGHLRRTVSGATLATHGSGAVTHVPPRDAVDASIWQRTDSLRPSRLSCLVRAIAGSGGRLE